MPDIQPFVHQQMYKTIYPEIKANPDSDNDDSDGRIDVRFTTNTIDRGRHKMSMEGMVADAIKNNPVFLWNHDMGAMFGASIPAIGTLDIKNLKVTNRAAEVPVQFDMEDEFAKQIYGKFKRKVLRAVSIGWRPLEEPITKRETDSKAEDPEDLKDGDYLFFRKWEWFELSATNVPMNPETLAKTGIPQVDNIVTAYMQGLQKQIENMFSKFDIPVIQPEYLRELKSVIPYKKMPLAPKDQKWSLSAAEQNLILGTPPSWSRYKSAHAWYDDNRPKTKSAYKLPHHKIIDGELKTVWKGVKSAMASLLGARGGAKIPEEDRKEVYEHLASHYINFNETVPEFKAYTDTELKSLFLEEWEELENYNIDQNEYNSIEKIDVENLVRTLDIAKKFVESLENTIQCEPDITGRAGSDSSADLDQAIELNDKEQNGNEWSDNDILGSLKQIRKLIETD